MRRTILTSGAVAALSWLWPLGLSALVLGTTVLSCTPLKPQEDTPSGAGPGDPDTSVNSLNDPWSCLESLGRESALVPSANSDGRWVYSRRVVDYVNGRPIPDVTVRACELADYACEQPVAEVAVDEEGWVDVPLTADFGGYFEFRAPTALPLMLFPSHLSPLSGSNKFPVALMDLAAATGLSTAVGAPLEPSLGVIMLYMFDCNGMPAAGLQVTSDRSDNPWYVVNSLPSFAARSTSMQGIGGFVNVAPGISVVRGTLDDGTLLAMPQAVYVRAGWFTAFLLDPSRTEP